MSDKGVKFKIGHLFAGMGGGALGAQAARVRIGDTEAYFETVGGIDIDAGAAADFEYLTGAPCAVADIHTMQPADLRAAMGDRAPDMMLLSPPCVGFSALLSKAKAKEPKYRELNQLVLKGLFLICSTWDRPPAIIFIENVPRITSRGKDLLAKARQLLRDHGYEVTENDYHDCGEIGGLAQHRRRFFMVARDPSRVPNFVYRPGKLRVRACGEVLCDLPMPENPAGGPLHKMPRISWLNWVRLALIPAGGDWRDLPGVVPVGKERREVHRRHAVAKWTEPTRTVVGPGASGAYNVADPRLAEVINMKQTGEGAQSFKGRPGLMGVQPWDTPTGAVTAGATVSGGNGTAAVADPRIGLKEKPGRHLNQYNVIDWSRPAKTIIAATRPGSGAQAVADPRNWHTNVLGVIPWDEPSGTVTGSAAPARGAFAVADPRLACKPRSGAYGVLSWEDAAAAITGSMAIDNGRAAIADPRKPPDFVPVIIAPDGTWHRPLTTLELAALQGFPVRHHGKPLELSGKSSVSWRKRIGNAIPPPAAQAVASEILLALLASREKTFVFRMDKVWVKDAEIDPRWIEVAP